jgi:hypothetical protein
VRRTPIKHTFAAVFKAPECHRERNGHETG